MAMSDRRLVQLGKERDDLASQIKELEEKKQALDTKIIAELDRRGTKTLISGGVQVTRAANSYTRYDYDGIMGVLLDEADRDEARKKEIDVDGLARLVASRRIKASRLTRFTKTRESNPYVRISYPKD